MKRIRKGFTLIEMVIVMAIIAMLLLLIIPNLAQQQRSAQEKADRAFVETVQNQWDMEKGGDQLKDVADIDTIGLSDKQKQKFSDLKKKIIIQNGKIIYHASKM